RLGVFVGGCLAAAALAVAEVALPTLKTLVNESLLKVETQADGESRFHLLETIREFALEQLQSHSEEQLLHQQHATYYLALAETADQHMEGAEKKTWLDQLESELDNLRAAYKWFSAFDKAGALRLAAALKEFWYVRGYVNEGRQWLTQVLLENVAPTE